MSGLSEGSQTESLGDLSDLADGEMRVFEDIGEFGIVVCRVGGELHAIADNCSHADTPLSEGRLRGALVVCPLHGAAFDVRDGTHRSPPAWEGVACHRLHVRDGEVSVDLTPSHGGVGGRGPNDDVGARFEIR